ncbi:hypothetical protein BH23ACT5_BH23ACT5_16940 [soil metagenome]
MAHKPYRRRSTTNYPGARRIRRVGALLTATALMVSCGDSGSPISGDDALSALQLVGVDFELNSILLTNVGSDPVRTEGLHLCQDGDCMEFNIFTIAPRATILFRVAPVGGVDPAGGELARHRSDGFDDPESVIDYVAWGTTGHRGARAAAGAELWNEQDYVPTAGDTIILTKVEPAIGSDSWQASAEIP